MHFRCKSGDAIGEKPFGIVCSEEDENFLTLKGPVVTICTARFNIQQYYVLPTQFIYVFCVDLKTNSDYFTIQH
jgi:hypothetical protein